MRTFLTAFAAALLAAAAASAQTTTITASHIAQDLHGTLLGAGQLCLTPVGPTGAPSNFQANGIQYPAQQTCTAVTSGAISGLVVPDTVAISPAGVGYKIAIEDQQGNIITSYTQPIYPTGSTWSLDTWSPTQSITVPNPTTVSRGVNPPQGRCGTNPAIYYTASGIWTCFNQIWIPLTSSSGALTSAAITTALTYVPVTPTQLASAIASQLASLPGPTASQITTALTYVPVTPTQLATYLPLGGGTLSGQVTLPFDPMAASQAATKHYVDTAIATAIGTPTGPSSPTATPTFSPVGGTYTAAQTVMINETTAFATVSYCANPVSSCTPNLAYSTPILVGSTETICVNALAATGGVVSSTSCSTYIINTGGTTTTGTGIGTIIAQGYETGGSVGFKTCYVGGSVCSGGVGSITLSSVPTHTFGLNTPSANTGLANNVGDFHLETATPGASGTQFSMALWTTSGGGFGANPTATNFYVGGWVKESYPAGPSRIEMDAYEFDSNIDWMWGTQCNSDKMLIQTDNQAPSWTYTSMPCSKLYDGNYHHVEFTFHRTLAADTSCSGMPCECWDTGTIDGVSTALNICKPATSSPGWSGSGWQFQIDGAPTTASSGSPAKYDLYCDSCQFISGLAGTSGGAGSPGGGGTTTTGTGDLDSFNFDSGTTTPTGLTPVGSPVVVATKEHSSPNSAHLPSGLNYYTDTITPTNTLYTRQYVYLNTVNGSLSDSFLRFYHGSTELFVYFFDTPSQHLTYFNQATGASVTAYATTFPTGGWHYIETYTKIDPTAGHVTVKIDGTQVYDLGSLNTGTLPVNTVWFGNIGATAPTGWDTYEDNVDFDDSNWIGPI
jgi:hypothetical protein